MQTHNIQVQSQNHKHNVKQH